MTNIKSQNRFHCPSFYQNNYGARIGFEEDLKGTIETGKLADFTVLSDDPHAAKPEEVGDIKVEMTIVGGKVVYSD